MTTEISTFSTDNPFAADRDLTLAGWTRVSRSAAASERPENAVWLYARDGRLAWLAVENIEPIVEQIAEFIGSLTEQRREEAVNALLRSISHHNSPARK